MYNKGTVAFIVVGLYFALWAIQAKQDKTIDELKQINKTLENFMSEPIGVDDE